MTTVRTHTGVAKLGATEFVRPNPASKYTKSSSPSASAPLASNHISPASTVAPSAPKPVAATSPQSSFSYPAQNPSPRPRSRSELLATQKSDKPWEKIPPRPATGQRYCLCQLCSCETHRCPLQRIESSPYSEPLVSTAQATYRPIDLSGQKWHKGPSASKLWDDDDPRHVSTTHDNYKGVWTFDAQRPRTVETYHSKGRFDGNSTHRADFVPFPGAKPQQLLDAKGKINTVFEWDKDGVPKTSVMRDQYPIRQGEFCPVRTLQKHVRGNGNGGHMFFVKDKQGKFYPVS